MWKIAAVIVQQSDDCPPQVDAFTTCEWADDPKVAAVRFQLEMANSTPYQMRFLLDVKMMQLRAYYALGRLVLFDSPVDMSREQLQKYLRAKHEIEKEHKRA